MVSGFFTSPLDQDRMVVGRGDGDGDVSTWLTFRGRAVHGPFQALMGCWDMMVMNSFSGLFSDLRKRPAGGVRGDFLVHPPDWCNPPSRRAQGLHFLHQNVERFRDAGLERVVAFDDAFVDARAALHVVGLHGQEFLQRVGRAVGFHRPHFHFTEALAAVLRLAAQRLLGDERVRTDGAGVILSATRWPSFIM